MADSIAIVKYIILLIVAIVLIVVGIALYIYMRNLYDRRYYRQLFSDNNNLKYKVYNIEYSLQNWMSNIKPSTPLNQLIMPGTHDSLTFEWEDSYSMVQQYSSRWAKTQYLTVSQQLLSGVRYIDARVGMCLSKFCDDTKVVCFHGDFSTNVLYDDCVKELIDFINTNPSEIVIWKFRILNNNDRVKDYVAKLHSVLNCIPPTQDYFNLSLGELMSRRPDKTRGGVIFVSGDIPNTNYVWMDSTIFDPYNFEGLMIDRVGFLTEMTTIYSGRVVPPTSLCVMQMIAEYQPSSKTSFIWSIESIATDLNKTITTKTLPEPPKRGHNVIMIDFCTPELCNGIIQYNQPTIFIG
jgi:hypothetical protein